MIEWFIRNPVAANLLMVAIVAVGLFSASRLIPMEVFPSFEVDSVRITTVHRGATPGTISDNITKRIEDRIHGLQGIKQIVSRSSEGVSNIFAELDGHHEKRKILNDIKLRIDTLSTLPVDAERPIVSLVEINPEVIEVVVSGNVSNKLLRDAAEKVRDDLLKFKDITLVNLANAPQHEISIEVSAHALEKYRLSLTQIAQFIRQGAVDISAGNIKTVDGDILIRTDGQAYTKEEFERIPILQASNGKSITLKDIAQIEDGFEDKPLVTRFNGNNAILINVQRTGKQSSLQIAKQVKQYIAQSSQFTKQGIQLHYWADKSKILRDRLSTLLWSGIQGGILVLILLSLFLRPAIAFWVFWGIPVSFMGAFILMPFFGGTFNVISLFAFITVLGIVVDDAIVTGENIYRKMRSGLDSTQSAIIGTKQIALPVTFGILTTIVAFYPLAGLGDNRIGFFAIQIPIVAIPVLLFSLIESKLILPSHLSHIRPRTNTNTQFAQFQMRISRGLENFALIRYQPFLISCLRNKTITIASLLAVSAIIASYAYNGHIRFVFFPQVEAEKIEIELAMPETTSFATTSSHIHFIQQQIETLKEKYSKNGESAIKHIYSNVGSNKSEIKSSVGSVVAELAPREARVIDINASQISREARHLIGEIPGAKKLSVIAEIGRSGEPINIELKGESLAVMSSIGDKIKQQLKKYPYVFDIQDNYSNGKTQVELALNHRAHLLGLQLSDVMQQVRSSVFGAQAQRIQRGRNEVRVMVRLPKEQRASLHDLNNVPIRLPGQARTIALSDIATLNLQQSSASLYRVDRNTVVNITADIDKNQANTIAILSEIQQFLQQEQQYYPQLEFTFKGESEEQSENLAGFISGLLLLLVSIYALLAIPFKSYTQPLVVMSIMPFSVIGAILGHMLLGYNISILSVVGMMALLGVVVNDSLVLVDYINQQRKKEATLIQAVINSGIVRFRPVLLTSLTTFAGLSPLLFGKNVQAAFLKPMAISLSFGILFATLITLIIVPVLYLTAFQMKQLLRAKLSSLLHPSDRRGETS